jgi:hypothetical protein
MPLEKPEHLRCRVCYGATKHDFLFEHSVETNPWDYHEKTTWQVLRCRGCESIRFRIWNEDYEISPSEDEDGNPLYLTSESLYPRSLRSHKPLPHLHFVPEVIRNVYGQSITALGEQANILASIGLRACVEAVCNHLSISGSSLDKRIDGLFRAGHVSNTDKKRLHAIRFLGNDAAHEIREPDERDLLIALDIVDHLLNSVFILERRARRLETVIETYDEFMKLVVQMARVYDEQADFTLLGLLGRQKRQVPQYLEQYELQLQIEIDNETVAFLSKTRQEQQGQKLVQFYSLHSDKLPSK